MPKVAVRKRKRTDDGQLRLFGAGRPRLRIHKQYEATNDVTLYHGDCLELLRSIPAEAADLVVTSPPYNIGKEYETKLDLAVYVEQQTEVIHECIRVMSSRGSICWQVGNYVYKGAIIPLDTILYPIFASAGLRMRNRIIWHFEHGLHCTRRFSGRYEVIIWFTKSDNYLFNLDRVRVPQKYPGKKHFKGARAAQYSSNRKGKVRGHLWIITVTIQNPVQRSDQRSTWN